jgi:hypothetical protein
MSARRIALASIIVWAGYQYLPQLLAGVGLNFGDPGSGSMFSPNSIATTLILAVVLAKVL